MITDIEEFFVKGCGRCARFDTPECSALVWCRGLADLRRICRDAGLAETVKWGNPCYAHAGRNIAILGAFRDDFRMTFFNAALMRDPEGILEKAGPNTQHAGLIRFADSAGVTELEPVIRAYISEAMGYADKEIVPEKTQADIDLPDELVAALDDDPALAEAFDALTPGRQRSYVINLNGAKKAETRRSRIAGFRDKIIDGKGATDR